MVARKRLFAALCSTVAALENGLGLTPPMGYNTWNDLGCDGMSENHVKAVADAMVSKGLLDAGYAYLNLDDCWMAEGRDAHGRLQGDPERFPSGMKALGDYIHDKGLKFGIYTDRGTKTCQNLPASLGNEELDAQTFADWGVDYVKEDNCHSSTGANDKDALFEQFGLMRDALNATGRPIFFSVCGGGDQMPWNDITYYATDPRGGGKLANAWRISPDAVEWLTTQRALRLANSVSEYGGPGGVNDPDMLLGTSKSSTRYMSEKHSRAQFNLWAILMAPLLLGTSIRDLNAFDLETYTNSEVVAVDQDPLGEPGKRLQNVTSFVPGLETSVWGRKLSDGSAAVLFMNSWPLSYSVTCDQKCWQQLPFDAGTMLDVRDLWAHGPAHASTAVAGQDYSVQVEGLDGTKMLKFTPKSPAASVVAI